MKRKKRLKKGIESIEKQISKHRKKLEKAKNDGEDTLAKYYIKELEKFERETKRKKDQVKT